MLYIIYPYYTNKTLLLDQLERWECYSDFVQSNIHIIIVDDGSPHSTALEVINSSKFKIKSKFTLLKIHEDLLWNTAGARNLGVHYVKENFGSNEMVFLSLMDAMLPNETIKKNIKRRAKQNLYLNDNIHLFERKSIIDGKEIPSHVSLMLLTPATFFSVGGFDEDFTGAYGHDDSLFHYAIKTFTPILFNTLKCPVLQIPHHYEYDFIKGKNSANGNWREACGKSRNEQIFNSKQKQTLSKLLSSPNLRFKWSKLM